jgi:hypothetical protein
MIKTHLRGPISGLNQLGGYRYIGAMGAADDCQRKSSLINMNMKLQFS